MIRLIQIGLLFIGAQLFTSCLGAPFVDDLSGDPITGQAPYFHHRNLFINNDPLYIGIDPNRYINKINTQADIYVVEHKNWDQWTSNPSLIDVIGPPGSTPFTLTPGDLSTNNIPLGNLNIPDVEGYPYYKEFDIVADFNRNGIYDEATDIIDYIGTAELIEETPSGGLTVVKAPDENGNFEVGILTYSGGMKKIPGTCACPNVPSNININIVGKIFYPRKDGSGHDLSDSLDTYPLIIIAHGNGVGAGLYHGFDYLGKLFASRGYIVASIDLHLFNINSPPFIYERGEATILHLDYLLDDPGISNTFIKNTLRPNINREKIGLIGHSRGGEGIIAAQDINLGRNNPTYTIAALCSLAPTDITLGTGNIKCGPFNPKVPYLMISATRDRDLIENPGYRILDKAARPKFGLTLYGGNHQSFNFDTNPDLGTVAVCADTPPAAQYRMLCSDEQQRIAKIYAHSFMNIFLKGQQVYFPLFNNFTTPTIARNLNDKLLTHLYQPTGWGNARLTVDDFEQSPANINTNSLPEPNNHNALVDISTEDWLGLVTSPTRNYYPHYSNGGRLGWKNTASAKGLFEFEIGGKSIMYYNLLNFRIAQRYRLGTANINPANTPQNLKVYLTDGNGNNSDIIAVGAYCDYEIPYTDIHSEVVYEKSIMQTASIPLRAFTANGATIDLEDIHSINFQFEPENIGELIIDDIELLGLDFSEPDPKPISQIAHLFRRIFVKNWPKKSIYKIKKGE